MLLKNKVLHVNLLAILLSFGLTACNNAGNTDASTQNSATDIENSTKPTQKMFGKPETHTDELYFNSDLMPSSGIFFTLTGSAVPNGQPGVNNLQQLSNGITIDGPHHESAVIAEWLTQQNYAAVNSANTNTVSPDDFNYGVTGNLSFAYKPNANVYDCPNVAIAYISNPKGKWMFLSNIKPGFGVQSDQNKPLDGINILCNNETTKHSEIFKVIGSGNKTTFNISKNLYQNESFGTVLTESSLTADLVSAYNSLSGMDQINLYGKGTYAANGLTGRQLYISNPRNVKLTYGIESTIQDNIPVATETQSMFANVATLYNRGVVQQTLTTQAVSKSVTDSVTTVTESGYEVGGEVGASVKTEYGFQFIVQLKGDITVSGKFAGKYTHKWATSVTTSTTSTYTLTPQNILVPPKSVAIVTAYLGTVTYNGTFRFYQNLNGSATVNGTLFANDSTILPQVYTGDSINVYDVFSKAKNVDPQVVFHQGGTTGYPESAVSVEGKGSYEGVNGTVLYVNVDIYPLNPDGTINFGESLKKESFEARPTIKPEFTNESIK